MCVIVYFFMVEVNVVYIYFDYKRESVYFQYKEKGHVIFKLYRKSECNLIYSSKFVSLHIDWLCKKGYVRIFQEEIQVLV